MNMQWLEGIHTYYKDKFKFLRILILIFYRAIATGLWAG
jgi:hypothetical protein